MELVRPTLILDKEICLRNIERMANKAKENKLLFRPHFKTHQSAVIGEWFKDFGVKAITVSSVHMASYFAQHGWDDITIALPFNIHEINQINKLAQEIKINLLVENKESAEYLIKFLKFKVGIFIKIDTGYNRTGILSNRVSSIDNILELLKEKSFLEFKGFLTHAGHNYHAKSKYEVFNQHFDALLKMRSLKTMYQKNYPNLIISLGDTPSASICENFDGVDELRPGNFIFYDLMQFQIGSCSFEDIAVRLACPIIAKHASRNEVVIYGGAVHSSKDSIINMAGKQLFGRIVVTIDGEKVLLDERNYLCSMSQEHGTLKIMQKDFKLFNIGDFVEIIPVHSCLTANLMGGYLTTEGEHIGMLSRLH